MNYVPMSLGMFIIHRLSAADQYRVCGIVVVSQIHHIYMTCNLQSNPERDKRGKWPLCEYGLLEKHIKF